MASIDWAHVVVTVILILCLTFLADRSGYAPTVLAILLTGIGWVAGFWFGSKTANGSGTK